MKVDWDLSTSSRTRASRTWKHLRPSIRFVDQQMRVRSHRSRSEKEESDKLLMRATSIFCCRSTAFFVAQIQV